MVILKWRARSLIQLKVRLLWELAWSREDQTMALFCYCFVRGIHVGFDGISVIRLENNNSQNNGNKNNF